MLFFSAVSRFNVVADRCKSLVQNFEECGVTGFSLYTICCDRCLPSSLNWFQHLDDSDSVQYMDFGT